MTAPHIVDPARLLDQAVSDASPDLMRHLLSTVINALLSAEADAVCGAEYGTPSPDRVAQRNGYRHRDLDTRTGTINVDIPKLRSGSYFPDWLLERRKRAEPVRRASVSPCSSRVVAVGYFPVRCPGVVKAAILSHAPRDRI
jgi:transposase-like protein